MIVLIQCTKTKRDEPAKARDLYDESDYFCIMRKYAKLHGDEWCILSGKHGLVRPNTELEPYDAFGLSQKQAQEIAENIQSDTVELVAGKKYTEPLKPELEARGINVIDNLEGLRIGNRMSAMNKAIRQKENDDIC